MGFKRAPIFLALAVTALSAIASERPGWIEVDYGDLVDMRLTSHSGEPVSVLLRKLDGRPMPPPGTPSVDLTLHKLLEPLLEPYAFVLSDLLDSLGPPPDRPWVEIGSLWEPGSVQPAWVELLRSRRFLVESDGHGRMRMCLPYPGAPAGALQSDPKEAARLAWESAKPVLRFVLESERLRRTRDSVENPGTLQVEVHAYVHHPALTRFHLGREAHVFESVKEEAARPPVDLAAWQSFLDSGLLLEGARIDPDGTVRLLGSEVKSPPTLLGDPITLADFAVAYRAVFHGGAAEPYMSLDRGYSPWTAVVNYGGRLRDTRLGMVALLCDIRFKTFSLGLDVSRRQDLREGIRRRLPSFRTHLERFAADPRAAGILSQQTRLWFYPDRVDLTVSDQGDVLVLRKVRMTAASERLAEGGVAAAAGGEAPWTRATIDAINGDYDQFAALFPELNDLDHVVRLLSLFTWLKYVAGSGGPVPDLDSLLAIELPVQPTPRTFPQLLTFNALSPAGSRGAVDLFDRISIAHALERLESPSDGLLPARMRFERAIAGLDSRLSEHASMITKMQRYDSEKLHDAELDFLAYGADRLRMHHLVLTTLPEEHRRGLAERSRSGERLRLFSVGIGGLDLGMGKAVGRAMGAGRSIGLSGAPPVKAPRVGGPMRSAGRRAGGRQPAPAVKRESQVTISDMPRHGVTPVEEEGKITIRSFSSEDGPEVRSREIRYRQGTPPVVEFRRYERKIFQRYVLEGTDGKMKARTLESGTGTPVTAQSDPAAVEGIALLGIDRSASPSEQETVRLRLTSSGRADLEADFSRKRLQLLVLGREAAGAAGWEIPGLAPLPEELGNPGKVLVVQDKARTRPPYEIGVDPAPGEEDAFTVARALSEWWKSPGAPSSRPSIAVGTSPGSAAAWSGAPKPASKPLLLLPPGGFPGYAAGFAGRFREAWRGGPVTHDLNDRKIPSLVVLASAEPPGLLARRLRSLSRDPRMKGKLLAVWSLAGRVRTDLPASLLADGNLAGFGLAEMPMVEWDRVASDMKALLDAAGAAGGKKAVEELPGPLLWYY